MSLNKFSDNTIKNYLNIGCDTVDCKELKLNNGILISPTTGESNLTIETIAPNIFIITDNEVYYVIDGDQMTINFKCNVNAVNLVSDLSLRLTIPAGKLAKNLNDRLYGNTIINNNQYSFFPTNISTSPTDKSKIEITYISPTPNSGNLYVNGSITVLIE